MTTENGTWCRRRERTSGRRRVFVAMAAVVLVAGIVAALTLYASNQKSGTWTTGEGLSIGGFAVPSAIDIETQTDVAGSVANGLSRNMTGIVVRMNVTANGLVAADLSIAFALDHTVWIPSTPSSCGADCLSFAGDPFDLGALASVFFDVRITVYASGSYSWLLYATGSA